MARFATYRDAGGESVAARVSDDGTELVALADPLRTAIATGRLEPAPDAARRPLAGAHLLAPVPDPGTVFAVGLNYAAHVAEGGRRAAPDAAPRTPLVFVKVAASVTGPAGPVTRPDVVAELDYEGELAVVVGAGGGVFGYTVADDVSARDLQRAEPQWTRAKGGDGFCPLGPVVVTADEAGDPGPGAGLRLRTWVNGELRQDASTSEMIHPVGAVLAFLGQTTTLRPGDVVLMGTPAGVGAYLDPPRFLEPGDVVRVEIEGVGAIEHAVVARPAP